MDFEDRPEILKKQEPLIEQLPVFRLRIARPLAVDVVRFDSNSNACSKGQAFRSDALVPVDLLSD